LRSAGFRKVNRHWDLTLASGPIAVEFPEAKLAGDEARVEKVRIRSGVVTVIGLDDLYLNRLLRSTHTEREGIEFNSALAVAAAGYEAMDWPHVERRIGELSGGGGAILATRLKRNDSRIRGRVRRLLSEPTGQQ
jgi:hypothetical protein